MSRTWTGFTSRRRLFLASTGAGPSTLETNKRRQAQENRLTARNRPVTLIRMKKALQISLLSAIAITARAQSPGGEDALAAYARGDYKTALKLLGPMAEDGNTFAEFTIGKMYVYGEGVSKDPKKGAVFIQ